MSIKTKTHLIYGSKTLCNFHSVPSVYKTANDTPIRLTQDPKWVSCCVCKKMIEKRRKILEKASTYV